MKRIGVKMIEQIGIGLKRHFGAMARVTLVVKTEPVFKGPMKVDIRIEMKGTEWVRFFEYDLEELERAKSREGKVYREIREIIKGMD